MSEQTCPKCNDSKWVANNDGGPCNKANGPCKVCGVVCCSIHDPRCPNSWLRDPVVRCDRCDGKGTVKQ